MIGCVDVWLYGSVTVWLYGCVTVWLCGFEKQFFPLKWHLRRSDARDIHISLGDLSPERATEFEKVVL